MRFDKKFSRSSLLLLIGLLIVVPLLIILIQRLKEGAGSGGEGRHCMSLATGNDTNDGSQAHPFATLQQAASVVTPGTTVHVLPGTYTDPVTLTRDGTAQARIIFRSETRWGAKIKTTGSQAPWTTRADYIDIVGFDISSTEVAMELTIKAPSSVPSAIMSMTFQEAAIRRAVQGLMMAIIRPMTMISLAMWWITLGRRILSSVSMCMASTIRRRAAIFRIISPMITLAVELTSGMPQRARCDQQPLLWQ